MGRMLKYFQSISRKKGVTYNRSFSIHNLSAQKLDIDGFAVKIKFVQSKVMA